MPKRMNCVSNFISGKLRVRDLAYEKNVGIRYCIDDKTLKKCLCFAAFYEDLPTNNWYWDNNFEND